MKNIFYWSPFIGNVATIKAVINSAFSLSKFSKGSLFPSIINSGGEWNEYENEINLKKIKSIELQRKYKINTKINGFFKSRLEYLKIFIYCYFPLKNLITRNNPNYLIVHLITSLPIILYLFNNFETKLIIRISGKVKFTFFRKLIWKLASKKIYLITCPTIQTMNDLKSQNIFPENKIIFLPDPIINITEINKNRKQKMEIKIKDKYILTVGRFTKQKNHNLIFDLISQIKDNLNDLSFVIIGNGELKNDYLKTIKKKKIENRVKIIDYSNNIFPYINDSFAVLSTSIWEDPGFVMIESAACNKLVISSDCPSGPNEFIGIENGILFKNNDLNDLKNKIEKVIKLDTDSFFKMKVGAKKKSKYYTKLNHYKILSKYFK